MPYVVCHVEKCKGALTVLGQHIDREKVPLNADESRTRLNLDLIPPRSKNLTDDVNARIAEGYKGKKAIRHDAVKAFKIVFSGSNERMKELEADPHAFRQWQDANLRFVNQRFGSQNVVRFTLHMDEITPHIHAVIVPITENGQLSAKALLDGPKAVAQLQTDYANAMKPFGLERGKENSTAKHTDISEYYGRVNTQAKAYPELNIPVRTTWEKQEPYHIRVKNAIVPFVNEKIEQLVRMLGQLRGENERLKKEVQALRKAGVEGVTQARKEGRDKAIEAFETGKSMAMESLMEPLKKHGLKLEYFPKQGFKLETYDPQKELEAQERKRAEEALKQHEEHQKKQDRGQNRGGMSM